MLRALATILVVVCTTQSLHVQAYGLFVLSYVFTLAVSRIDPIIAPGSVSAHVHNILGASNFNSQLNDYATQQSAQCSTSIVGADKSNYWSPMVYFINAEGKYEAMLGASRIYYFVNGEQTVAFPKGLRMISGQALTRNMSAIQSAGLLLTCDGQLQTSWLPNGTSFPGGCGELSMGMFLPSCGWANQSLDSDDHFSHMAWPIGQGGGETWIDINGYTCPDSHPIKYPNIFVEFNYWLSGDQVWRENDINFVLATGDTTGGGYHVDFYNGWDEDVLTAAIQECGNIGDNLGACPPFLPTLNSTEDSHCMLEGMIPDEEVGFYRPLEQLPGCNPLWTVDMPDTHPVCESVATPGWVYPNVYFSNLEYAEHIPLALAEAVNVTDLGTLVPTVGAGDSWIAEWGTYGSDASLLKVGTAADILKNLDGVDLESTAFNSSEGGSAMAAVNSSTSVSSSSSSTKSATMTSSSSSSSSVLGNNNLATLSPSAITTNTASISITTTSSSSSSSSSSSASASSSTTSPSVPLVTSAVQNQCNTKRRVVKRNKVPTGVEAEAEKKRGITIDHLRRKARRVNHHH